MKSFFDQEIKIQVGDFESAFEASEHKLEGELSIGGQEHFYMETQCCLVNPQGESNEVEVFCSTQSLDGVQESVARALKVPKHKIVARIKRLGKHNQSNILFHIPSPFLGIANTHRRVGLADIPAVPSLLHCTCWK